MRSSQARCGGLCGGRARRDRRDDGRNEVQGDCIAGELPDLAGGFLLGRGSERHGPAAMLETEAALSLVGVSTQDLLDALEHIAPDDCPPLELLLANVKNLAREK
jgi:hypothetical protein